MASKTVVELVDDLDGGLADETVSFALDGIDYTIDLSTEHASLLREQLASYIGRARKTGDRTRRSAGDEVVTLTQHTAEAPKTAPAAPRRTTRRTTTHHATKPVEEPAPASPAAPEKPAAAAPVPPVPSSAPEPAPASQPSGPLAALAVPFQEATH